MTLEVWRASLHHVSSAGWIITAIRAAAKVQSGAGASHEGSALPGDRCSRAFITSSWEKVLKNFPGGGGSGWSDL